MVYQALYRKYRPQLFADVLGQEHITTTLKNQVESGRVSHAYVFSGSRGTGKTTTAKILARAVNCAHPVNGECEYCLAAADSADIIELDAASNNGVDDVRAIIDKARFTPLKLKKKVYIIDEAHMLSRPAFNALLKTLEEPPEHVIFILATTEVHKIPATIQSRCQRFDFKRIAPEVIRDRLLFIAGQEDMTLTEEAAATRKRHWHSSPRKLMAVCAMPFLSLIFAGHTPMISPWRPSAKRPGLWGRIIFLRSPMPPRRGILQAQWMPWSAWPDRLWNMTACAVN